MQKRAFCTRGRAVCCYTLLTLFYCNSSVKLCYNTGKAYIGHRFVFKSPLAEMLNAIFPEL